MPISVNSPQVSFSKILASLVLSSRLSAATAFNPLTITDLWGWWDPSDAATITQVTGVSQMDDKSGNGHHFVQATGSRQPTYSASAFGSLSALLFDGVAHGMVTTDAGNFANRTYYIVLKQVSVAAGVKDILVCATGTADFFELYRSGAVINTFRTANNNHVSTLDTNPHVLTAIFDVLETKVLLDNTNTTTGTNAGSTSKNAAISLCWYSPGTTNFNNAYVGEIIIASSVHGSSEQTAIHSYLKAKWGTP